MFLSILIATALAVAVTGLAAWWLRSESFRSLPWVCFMVGSAIFWGVLAALMIGYGWRMYYAHFVPAWFRFAGPLAAMVVYPVLALLIRWASLRLPGNPTVGFCLLGGLEAIPEHAVGIYRFRILDIPALQGLSPASVFLFSYFEYVVFWGITLMLVAVAGHLARRGPSRSERGAR